MSSTMQTSEILNRAADILEDRGWTCAAGWYPDPNSRKPVCVEGAVRLAAAETGVTKAAVCGTLSAYLTDRFPECANSIAGRVFPWLWNDAPDRTASEVIEVLRACAVIEASRERQAVTA